MFEAVADANLCSTLVLPDCATGKSIGLTGDVLRGGGNNLGEPLGGGEC
jgi:hypothetical protein